MFKPLVLNSPQPDHRDTEMTGSNIQRTLTHQIDMARSIAHVQTKNLTIPEAGEPELHLRPQA